MHIKRPRYQIIAEDIAAKIVEKNTSLVKRSMQDLRLPLNTVFHLRLLVALLQYYKT